MIRLGPGRTRATLAWLSGAIMAFALIGTCLALLRSDILPFRDAWPSAHGSRTPVSQLAPPQAASQPAGRPSLAAQPTTIAGGPTIGLPGLPTAAGPLTITGSGPLAATPGSSGSSGATGARRDRDAPGDRQHHGRLQAPGALPSNPTLPAPTPTAAASSVPDVAAAVADVAIPAAAANRPGPTGRSTDADATRADDTPPTDTAPQSGDTPVTRSMAAGPPARPSSRRPRRPRPTRRPPTRPRPIPTRRARLPRRRPTRRRRPTQRRRPPTRARRRRRPHRRPRPRPIPLRPRRRTPPRSPIRLRPPATPPRSPIRLRAAGGRRPAARSVARASG